MTAWSDDPAFWEAMEPALCTGARLARAEGDVVGIAACVGLRPASRVLDLACGPGAHAIALARRGHRVTGVDTSSRLLTRARAAAAREGAQVEWVEADMREFRRPASFNLVCSLYASFGYFDDRQNRCVLENVRESLAPGGTLVLDVLGREAAIRHGQGRRMHEVEGIGYRENSTVAGTPSRLVSDWSVVRDGARLDFRVTQRLYSASELRELLLSVGFASVRLAGGLDGEAPYDEAARRLVAVARRPTNLR
jgi:SAM-dependent methyltransferase